MTRWTTRILATALAATMGLGAVAVQAQPRNGPPSMNNSHDGRHDNGRPGDRHDRHDKRYDSRHDNRPGNRPANRPGHRPDMHRDHDHRDMRGAGPDYRWQRGMRVPPQYRSYNYVVNDWRGHRLSAPPRGYQWIQNGSDYLLVAVATGVITSIILNSSY